MPEVKNAAQVTQETRKDVSNASRDEQIEAVIARAESQIGVPYAWGGGDANGPTKGIRDGGVADRHGDYNKTGFDCSGLVLYAYAGAGVDLPHYTGYQYQRGTKVPVAEAQRGDLLFWGPGGNQHVAIYLGDGMMLEAPQSGQTVQKTKVRYSGLAPEAVRLI
nr:NlpC/P60 family protein [Corynebacterium aquatimens]